MKNLLKKAVLTSLTLGILAGCASEEDNIVMAPVPEIQNQFETDVTWETSVGSGVGDFFSKLKPTFAYDKVFVASRDGVVKALAPTTGETLWELELDQDSPRFSGGLTASYDQVFVGSENGELYAINQANGQVNWVARELGEILTAPATDSNLVIVHTSQGNLIALDQGTGEQKWAISTESPALSIRGSSQPVTSSGGVFWGTASGRLAAALVEQGRLLWQQPIGTPQGSTEIDRLVDVDSAPVIVGRLLFIVGVNGNLTAIDLSSGQPAWKRKFSSANDLVTDGSQLYVVDDQDHISAVDARSGTELWTNDELENRLVTAPTVFENNIVVGDSEGYLHWLDKESGAFVSQLHVDGSGIAVAPIILDDGYLVVSRDGDIAKLTKVSE